MISHRGRSVFSGNDTCRLCSAPYLARLIQINQHWYESIHVSPTIQFWLRSNWVWGLIRINQCYLISGHCCFIRVEECATIKRNIFVISLHSPHMSHLPLLLSSTSGDILFGYRHEIEMICVFFFWKQTGWWCSRCLVKAYECAWAQRDRQRGVTGAVLGTSLFMCLSLLFRLLDM